MRCRGINLSAFGFGLLLTALPALPVIRRERREPANAKMPFAALGSAVSLVIISQVMTGLTARLPSLVLFTVFNGSGIVLVSLISAAIFLERLQNKNTCGIFLAVVSLILILYRM